MIEDFRFAFRQLRKSPGFTVAAVTVLAFGIGVNTAIFSLVNAMLFQPPAYERPSEIVQVFSQDKKSPASFRAFSYPTYCDIRDQNEVFSGVMAHDTTVVGIGEQQRTRPAPADIVSSNYFSVLGVPPAYGRAFLPEEEKPGSGVRVAVVSHPFSQKNGGDSTLLGRSITISGRPYTVVGIMPRGFTGTMSVFGPEIWLPLGVYDEINSNPGVGLRNSIAERNSSRLLVIGRLKPGITAEAALPSLKGLAANLEAAYPLEQKDQTFVTAPLFRLGTGGNPVEPGPVTALGGLLLTMAALVLLVACLNLANMLLARVSSRRKEIAVRLALGASRFRIIRQLLTEGFVLALLGGGCGLILAIWSLDFLIAAMGRMDGTEPVWVSGPSPVVLGATLLFCFIGTLGFALGPALKLSRSMVIEDLKQHSGEDGARRRWKFLPRNPLMVVQLAFSLALVTAGALLIRGATKAASVDTGLHAENNFLIEMDASLGGFDKTRTQELYRTLNERLAALPGVEHASISALIPFGNNNRRSRVQRAGNYPDTEIAPATPAEGKWFDPNWNSVSADYFAAAGLPILRGRGFTVAEATQPGGPAVAVIDDLLARELWPEGDALGQYLQFPLDRTARPEQTKKADKAEIARGEPIEVIGIVPATRMRPVEKIKHGSIYLPYSRAYSGSVFFFVKFNTIPKGTEAATAELLRRTVRSVDSALPMLDVKTFAQHFDNNEQLWIMRAGAALFSIFGALALGLSVVGVYGVKAYSVARRTREIGIRMALGAEGTTIQWMILREGFAMVSAGLVLGLLFALGTGRLVSSILFEVSSTDPFAFTIAPAVLMTAALLATWLPARRATKISPMEALRTE